jgi:hypothetical protein
MCTVSSFSPGTGETEGGRIEADKGGEAAGAFGVGKKFLDEISSVAKPAPDWDEGGIGGLPVSRIGN